MAKHTFIAEFEPAPQGFGIHFPDLPGCTSFAVTLDDAPAMAAEALALHLDGMVEDDEVIPQARPLSRIVAEETPAQGGVWAAVTAETTDDSERVNVYLPKSLLRQVEQFGARSGIDNRSTFIRLALRHYLRSEAREAATKAP